MVQSVKVQFDPINNMDWVTKTDRLLKGRTKRAVEKAAGWARNSLAASMSSGSTPTALRGARLAKALEVPAEWLFDDDRDWPPPNEQPPPQPGMEQLDALTAEIGRLVEQLRSGRRYDSEETTKQMRVMAAELTEIIARQAAEAQALLQQIIAAKAVPEVKPGESKGKAKSAKQFDAGRQAARSAQQRARQQKKNRTKRA